MKRKEKHKKTKILELLFRSFDDELKEQERKQLDEALKASPGLRREKDQLLAQRKAISNSAEQSFSPFFAQRVMSQINSIRKRNGLETFYEILKVAFRRFAIAGALVLVALITYNLATGDSLTTDEVFYASETTFEEILDLPLF
jgi:hypothetical protein